MPNSANRNNGGNNGSKGQPKDHTSSRSNQKSNPERSDVKHGSGDHLKTHRGDTGRSSNQGRKEASGGEVEE